MNTKNNNKQPEIIDVLDYGCLTTHDILERIVVHHDRRALDHFLNSRKLFSYYGRRLVLPDYIVTLARTAIPGYILSKIRDQEGFKDTVYDQLYERFMPMYSVHTSQSGTVDTDNTTTRFFKMYTLVLEGIKSWRDMNHEASQREEDQQVGILFQGLVRRHFWYSLSEARRKTNRLQIRYNWQIGNGSITVYRPVWISAHEIRIWLEENIDDPDPEQPGEQDRIQRLVDKKFGIGTNVPIDSIHEELRVDPEINESHIDTLYHMVTVKKDLENEHLRPAIRALGKEKIKELVVRIIEDIAYGEYNSSQILEDYHLSKSALSRFAGNRRDTSFESVARKNIPDLWRNLAEVIMSNLDNIEAAISAKVKKLLQDIIDMSGSNKKGTE